MSVFDPSVFDSDVFDAGASTTSITPSTGTLAITGQPAHSRPIHGNAGALALTGQLAKVTQTTVITPGTGSLSLSGQQVSVGSLSTIVSAEYTGDGNNPRTFESLGTVPLIVIVIGKDGSGNVVGAIKTGTMPSGKSQPLEIAQSASASTRSNRILDLTVNGFTVGSDLNVAGRSYAYVIFPAGRSSTVTTRTFVGPGGKPAVNSTLNVPSGAGVISGTNCFTSTGDEATGWARPIGSTVYSTGVTLITAGRRAIRNSDGAVLCEVTGAIDANSANGNGYIAGGFAGNTWHWEEYYVDLEGQVCDMIFLMADDTGGTSPSVPLTVIKPSEMPGTNSDWGGNGFGELDVFLGSDTDKALHINPRSSGGAPAITKGVTYHVVTFHDDEANTGVKLHTFTWTGTGPSGTPPTLNGMDFKPDWAFVFNNGGSMTWSKNTTTILGTNLHDRAFADGAGDPIQPVLVSWDSGGVTLAQSGEWNSNGTKYLGIFFVADASITPITPQTGALALTGQTPIVAKKISITPNTAEMHLVGKQPRITPNVTRITPNTGSLIIALKQPLRATKRVITPRTGSLSLTGKAVRTKESKGHKITPPTAEDPPTGGLQIFGKQPILKISIVPRTGTLTATGQKPFVRPPDFPIFTHTGALTATGQPVHRNVTITPGTGRLVADGQAGIIHQSFPTRITVNTGSLGLVGKQPILGTTLIPDTGALNFDTRNTEPILQRDVTRINITPRTGDLSISGVSPDTTPTIIVTTVITPQTGALNLTGQTPTVLVESEIPRTGALSLVGQQAIVKISIIPQTGSLNLQGQPITQNIQITPQTGSLVLTGQQPRVGSGVFIQPGTGSLNFVGQPVIVSAPTPVPPVPPRPTEVGGGVGLPHPRKLPFWPKPICHVEAVLEALPGVIDIRVEAEENELELLLLI